MENFTWPKNLKYIPVTGVFWRMWSRKSNMVDYIDSHGYIQIRIKGVLYQAHRLAWWHLTGEWPEEDVDHINGKGNDNRECNIREACRHQNNQNLKRRSDNTSGVKGVYLDKRRNKWVSKIQVEGRIIYLGEFHTLKEATKVMEGSRIKYHKEFCNHG